jgi:hypothetical protein
MIGTRIIQLDSSVADLFPVPRVEKVVSLGAVDDMRWILVEHEVEGLVVDAFISDPFDLEEDGNARSIEAWVGQWYDLVR